MIDILYHDDDFIVVNKPSGLLSVPGLSDPNNLHDQVLKQYPNARVVHRLDMATSGMLIFALHHDCQKRFGQMFAQKAIHKRYVAVLFGALKETLGEVNCPLICDWEQRPKQKIDWLNGKASHTYYQVLERTHNTTRVMLTPISGRTHQLRVHMLALGHPILGDALYNIEHSDSLAPRLLLHASQLAFQHPISNKKILLNLPPEF